MLKLFIIRILVFIIIFFPFTLTAQITYVNSASNPADNGTLNTATVTVTPPGSMRDGDIVFMIGMRRASNITTFAVSATGGQIWNELPSLTGTANISIRIFWCRFNGTWSASPSVNLQGTGGNSVIMHVFRPSTRVYSWAVDVSQASTNHAAAASITRTGVTTNNNNTLTFVGWFTADDNSWGTPSAGWTTAGSAQYRNLQGMDMSASFAYRILTTAGTTGDVAKSQTANSPDAATSVIVSFYPYRTNMSAFLLE